MAKITVQNTQITVIKQNEDDYISLTDMLKARRRKMVNVPQGERLVKLNQIAIQQMQVLEGNEDRKLLK